MRTSLVFLPLLVSLSLLADAQDRIFNGTESDEGQFPWQVAIYGYEYSDRVLRSCGGTIVNENWVISAAHCFDTNRTHILAGNTHTEGTVYKASADFQSIIGATVYAHPDYNPRTENNDIALLQLDTPIDFEACTNCRAISIVTENIEAETMALSSPAIASGWGSINADYTDQLASDDLLYTTLYITSCQTIIDAGQSVTTNMFCAVAGESKTCAGDSGGPLVVKASNGVDDLLAGIVSWGDGCDPSTGIAEVYTRVSQYEDWIRETTLGACCTEQSSSETDPESETQDEGSNSEGASPITKKSSGGTFDILLISLGVITGLHRLRRRKIA